MEQKRMTFFFPVLPRSPFMFFMLFSSPQKEKGWESHLPALFILFLGSKSPFSSFAVPCNLDASAQLCYKALLCCWLLLAVSLWYETLVCCAGQTVSACLCLG